MIERSAMSLPEEIYIHPDALFLPNGKPNIDLLRHEFGHILQYRRYNWSYFLVVAPVSAYSAATDPSNHLKTTWTEVEANTLSYIYFGIPADWNPSYTINYEYLQGVLNAAAKK